MDKRLLGASIVLLSFVLLTKTPLLSVLFAFIILGMIPGTTLTIPFWAMLIAYPLIFLLVVIWLGRQPLLIGEAKPPTRSAATKSKTKRKKSATSARSKRVAAKRRPRTAI